MNTIQEVREYLKRNMPTSHAAQMNPERLMAEVLQDLAGKCQSVGEFVSKAQKIPVTGAGIEQVEIANEYRTIVLDTIQG